MSHYRYYITVTNDSVIYTIDEVDRLDGKVTHVLRLAALEPFHLDSPEGLLELHAYFNKRGWELDSPIFNTADHYSSEILSPLDEWDSERFRPLL